jgi:hypothetical protein
MWRINLVILGLKIIILGNGLIYIHMRRLVRIRERGIC